MTFGRTSTEERQQRAAEREAYIREQSAARKEANLRGLVAGAGRMHRGTYGGETSATPVRQPAPKTPAHRSQKLRDSARGEACLVVIPGCPQDAAHTIWSHYRGGAGGKAGARKSDDMCGAYCCTYCDAVYDGQRPRPAGVSKDDVDRLWLEGHIRSLVRARQKGLLP